MSLCALGGRKNLPTANLSNPSDSERTAGHTHVRVRVDAHARTHTHTHTHRKLFRRSNRNVNHDYLWLGDFSRSSLVSSFATF